MRRRFSFLSLFVFLFVLSASLVTAAQLVNIGAAKRAAEYHGESIFEKDLKVCDHELLHWAWGEPAVYVFTLMREGDVYPSNILRDSTLLKGAYLVSIGKEEAGYEKMAQADRYWTVYVGATTDMPSFLRAHAGLPEHIVTQPLMNNLPRDPYWIYGDLFHILVTSRSQMGASDTKATEIHLNKVVALKALGHEKIDTIPANAEQIEWGRFSDARVEVMAIDKGTTVELKVKESNLQGKWWGCGAAAFYNCLKYLEEKGKVSTGGKSASFLQEWTSICYQAEFDGIKDYWSIPIYEIPGSAQLFRGLHYDSKITYAIRSDSRPGYFFTLYALEINSGYPCAISRDGNEPKKTKNIFNRHITTGIGYWYSGTQRKLIIHDGWKETPRPVWTKYSGYPMSQLKRPIIMLTFRPGKSRKYPTATPLIKGPNIVGSSETSSTWTWEEKFTSPNKVPVYAYSFDTIFRDSYGTNYKQLNDQVIPWLSTFPYNLSKNTFKPGTVETTYKLIDDNAHLFVVKKNVRLLSEDAYTGPVSGTITGHGDADPTRVGWKSVIDVTIAIVLRGSGTASDPYEGDLILEGYDVQTVWVGDWRMGPTKCSTYGSASISVSNGQIDVTFQALAKPPDNISYAIGPYKVSLKGKINTDGTITGTVTFDEDFGAGDYSLDAPFVKTIKLTKSN